MDYLQRASVTLLVQGDDLDPEELTGLLGCQPKVGVRMGETFIGHNGGTVTASTGKWIYSTGYREPPNIDGQIVELLGNLPGGVSIWTDLTTRFECYVALGIYFVDASWTGGIHLQPQTLRMLWERGLGLDFDMYAPAASR
jgi:hypothetical protein